MESMVSLRRKGRASRQKRSFTTNNSDLRCRPPAASYKAPLPIRPLDLHVREEIYKHGIVRPGLHGSSHLRAEKQLSQDQREERSLSEIHLTLSPLLLTPHGLRSPPPHHRWRNSKTARCQ